MSRRRVRMVWRCGEVAQSGLWWVSAVRYVVAVASWPVAEACGRRGENDVGDAVSGVVKVRWVCWTLKGKVLDHVNTSRVRMKNGRNVVGWVWRGVIGVNVVALHKFENGLDVGGCGDGLVAVAVMAEVPVGVRGVGAVGHVV